MYKQLIRPLLFLMSAETAHEFLIKALKLYRHLPFLRKWVRGYCDPKVKGITLNGIFFKDRIGLSAGLDKKGEYFDELADFGFGFLELGTVTVHPQSGNPQPRIFRLPEDESLISRTGFNNPGLKQFQANLKQPHHSDYALGININRDPQSEGKDITADFLYLFQELYHSADYFTLNWGSIDPVAFANVLSSLNDYRKHETVNRPIFIKLPADIPPETIDKVMQLADANDIEGFIATGPTMTRNHLPHYTTAQLEQIGAGGVSGKGISNLSYDVVRYLRSHQSRHLTLIGAGGVMTPQDAELMIAAGADLIQIYSAFIYSGPCVVKEMAGRID